MPETIEFISRLQQKDPIAIRQFVQDYAPYIIYHVKRYIRRTKELREQPNAEDIVQDIFLDLIDKQKLLHCYDPQKGMSLRGWILLYARRRAIDLARKLWRREKLMQRAILGTNPIDAERAHDKFDIEKLTHEKHLLKNVASLLSEEEYGLLLRIEGYGEDYDSMSIRYSMSNDALRQRLCRIRRKIQQNFTQKNQDSIL